MKEKDAFILIALQFCMVFCFFGAGYVLNDNLILGAIVLILMGLFCLEISNNFLARIIENSMRRKKHG